MAYSLSETGILTKVALVVLSIHFTLGKAPFTPVVVPVYTSHGQCSSTATDTFLLDSVIYQVTNAIELEHSLSLPLSLLPAFCHATQQENKDPSAMFTPAEQPLASSSLCENSSCAPDCLVNETLELLKSSVLPQIITTQLGLSSHYPASSCQSLLTEKPNLVYGHYWVLNSTGGSVQVYCDMERSCCNTAGGWMRLAYLNMSNPSEDCPEDFSIHIRDTPPLRTCVLNNTNPACASVYYSSQGVEHSAVCGRITGYQIGSTDAFQPYYGPQQLNWLFDGVAVYSSSDFVWGFVAGITTYYTSDPNMCPCSNPSNVGNTLILNTVPAAVDAKYFCESGNSGIHTFDEFYSDNPLWDGEGCFGSSSCCSLNNPPVFCSQLSLPTAGDIEIRACLNEPFSNEGIALELVEIFVQ